MNACEGEIIINLEFIYCILEWLETSREKIRKECKI